MSPDPGSHKNRVTIFMGTRRTTYTVCGNAPCYTVFIYTTIFRAGLDWLVSVLFRGSIYWSPGGEVMDFFVVYEVLKKYFY